MSHDNYRNFMSEKRLAPRSMLAADAEHNKQIPYITRRGHSGEMKLTRAKKNSHSYVTFSATNNGQKGREFIHVWTTDEHGYTTRAIHDHDTGDIIQHSTRAGTNNGNLYAMDDNAYWALHKARKDIEHTEESIDALVAKARQARAQATLNQHQLTDTLADE